MDNTQLDAIVPDGSPPPRSAYQQRVLEEKAQLDERALNLDRFRGTEAYQRLPQVEQDRLRLQYQVMLLYSDILLQRILAFGQG